MKTTLLTKYAVLAATVAIAGCTLPATLGTLNASSTSAAVGDQVSARAGAGNLALRVQWPQLPDGYNTQNIPFRAVKLVVTLSDAKGQALKDAAGTPVAPVTLNRTTTDPFAQNGYHYDPLKGYVQDNPMAWTLKEQAGVHVHAEVFDATNHSVGSDDRDVDIIGGQSAYVSMDIVAAGAPQLASVDPVGFRVGDQDIVLKGANFTQFASPSVFFQLEGYSYNDGNKDPKTDPNGQMYFLPFDAVRVVSDTEIRIRIADRLFMAQDLAQRGYAMPIADALNQYFQAGSTQKLFLGVMSEGVNSKRLEVNLQRTGTLTTSVVLHPGADAPVAAPDVKELSLLSAPYDVPLATGSTWDYVVNYGTNNSYRQEFQSMNGAGRFRTTSFYGNSADGSGFWEFDLDQADSFARQMAFFVRLESQGDVQVLGDETVQLWDGRTANAKHVFYNRVMTEDGSAARDAWVVPGVGVVRMVDTAVFADPNYHTLYRQTSETRLVGYQVNSENPAASPTPMPTYDPGTGASPTPMPTYDPGTGASPTPNPGSSPAVFPSSAPGVNPDPSLETLIRKINSAAAMTAAGWQLDALVSPRWHYLDTAHPGYVWEDTTDGRFRVRLGWWTTSSATNGNAGIGMGAALFKSDGQGNWFMALERQSSGATADDAANNLASTFGTDAPRVILSSTTSSTSTF